MAQKPVVVTEAEWEADKENVQRVETLIPGFPDADPIVAFVKVEHIDDVTEKPATGIETVPLLVPVEKDREEVVIGDDGEPEKNEDGSDKLKVVKYWDFEAREIDLGSASLKKLVTALKPYAEKSRERVVTPSRVTVPAKTSSGGSAHDLAAIRAWAQKAGHEVADKGRVPNRILDLYYDNNPSVKRPDGQQSF